MPADILNMGMASCHLATSRARKRRSTVDQDKYNVFGYNVSVSNNGHTYSEQTPFVVVDTRCLDCEIGITVNCTKKVKCLFLLFSLFDAFTVKYFIHFSVFLCDAFFVMVKIRG